jgi:hypothetical protein
MDRDFSRRGCDAGEFAATNSKCYGSGGSEQFSQQKFHSLARLELSDVVKA